MAAGRSLTPAYSPPEGRSARRSRRSQRARPTRLVWFACLAIGLYLLGGFAYGMWNGFRDQQRLNHVWSGEARARPTAAAPLDPALKQPVNAVDFAIRAPKPDDDPAVKAGPSPRGPYT